MRDKPLGESAAYQLWLATNAWQRLIRKTLDPLGLTHAQFAVLAFTDRLSRTEAAVTQAKLSRIAALDENMTSQVVRGLVARELLRRTKHPHDGRASCIKLSAKGLALLGTARAEIRPAMQQFFAPLPCGEAEFATLLRSLIEAADGHQGS